MRGEGAEAARRPAAEREDCRLAPNRRPGAAAGRRRRRYFRARSAGASRARPGLGLRRAAQGLPGLGGAGGAVQQRCGTLASWATFPRAPTRPGEAAMRERPAARRGLQRRRSLLPAPLREGLVGRRHVSSGRLSLGEGSVLSKPDLRRLARPVRSRRADCRSRRRPRAQRVPGRPARVSLLRTTHRPLCGGRAARLHFLGTLW